MNYGHAPEVIGTFDLDWDEYMHYMYLPVVFGGSGWMGAYLPERLKFVEPLLDAVWHQGGGWGMYQYVYITARRGYATPGNPLNRPGWHCDGFGTDDVNYVWADRFPTRFAEGTLTNVSEDHVKSIQQFDNWAFGFRGAGDSTFADIKTYPDKTLLRLDPYVIHSCPEIPEPGGERGFIKISVSDHKYNLKGNSHNHLFDYDWKMYDRAELRNDPAYAGGDAGPQ